MKSRAAARKFAITVWEQRVSPVFDAARTLLIAEIDGNTLVGVSSLAIEPDRPLELLQILRTQQVTLVICGAVSEQPAAMLEAAGIELIPFVAGDVHWVLDRFLHNRLTGAECRMPGCGRKICCRGKIRRGREIGGIPLKRGRAGQGTPAANLTTSRGSTDAPDLTGEGRPNKLALPFINKSTEV